MSSPLTPNDYGVLEALHIFRYLVRTQVQRVVFAHHKTGRGSRKQLHKLFRAGFVHRTNTLIPFDGSPSGCPAYWLSKQGAEALATYLDRAEIMEDNPRPPSAARIAHWIAISQAHILLREAVALSKDVELLDWRTEWDILRRAEQPDKFYLQTVFRQEPSPLSCSPDAAFVLQVDQDALVYYVEIDRNHTGVKQFAASKSPGYAEMVARRQHRMQFPQATLDWFRILVITTTTGRRNRLAEAVDRTPRADLWLFSSLDELTPESFLHTPIFYDTKLAPGPLVQTEQEDEEAA